jgi:hypothetical protein
VVVAAFILGCAGNLHVKPFPAGARRYQSASTGLADEPAVELAAGVEEASGDAAGEADGSTVPGADVLMTPPLDDVQAETNSAAAATTTNNRRISRTLLCGTNPPSSPPLPLKKRSRPVLRPAAPSANRTET